MSIKKYVDEHQQRFDPQPRCIASWMNWLFEKRILKKCDENKLLQSKLQAINETRCEFFLSQCFYFVQKIFIEKINSFKICKFYVHYFEIPRLPSLFDDGNNDTEWDVLGKMIWFSYAIKMCVFKFSGGVRCAWFSDSLLHLQFIMTFRQMTPSQSITWRLNVMGMRGKFWIYKWELRNNLIYSLFLYLHSYLFIQVSIHSFTLISYITVKTNVV